MSDRTSGHAAQHLDLDTLADLLAADTPAADAHLEACEACRARLTELRAALDPVAVSLAQLPLPPEPADLDRRLTTAVDALRVQAGGPPRLSRVSGAATPAQPRRLAWLPLAGGLAAASAIVLAVVVVNPGADPSSAPDPVTALEAASGRINNTGLGYGRDGKVLAAELPALLSGTARPAAERGGGSAGPSEDTSQPTTAFAPPDPLERLRTTDGLASCLTSLQEGESGSAQLPLALDYATFEAKPALVVVLPAGKPEKVDVFIVGAGCAQADADLLYFARLPAPA